MLPAKGNTDNRNAKKRAENNMNKRSVQATGKYPNYIEQYRKTSTATISRNYFFAEGHQNQVCYFKTLQSERNTNNSEAQNKSANKISDCRK